MSFLSKWKKISYLIPSDTTVRIIANNYEKVGVQLPLSQDDLKKVFDWAIYMKERCTERECTINLDGFTYPELETLIKELNPYNDERINLPVLNREIRKLL